MVVGFGGIDRAPEAQIFVVVVAAAAGHSMSGLPDDAHYIFNFLNHYQHISENANTTRTCIVCCF